MKGKNKDANTKTPQVSLSFPNFVQLDHVKLCPRYTSVLNRSEGDGVGIEEIDMLQMEIESLLVNVMQRNRQLKIETMILDDWNGDKNNEVIAKISSPMTNEKQNSMNKKIKSFTGKPVSLNKSISKAAAEEANSAPIVRNDIPDTFWQSVEPYCANITEDDLNMIQHQIEIQDNYMSMHRSIPPIGKHYSLQWAEDDLNHQIKEGSRLTDYEAKISTPAKQRQTDSTKYTMVNSLIEESLSKVRTMPPFSGKNNKKTNEQKASEAVNYGPLTQRLISALIEQNLMTPMDNEISDYLDKIGPPPQPIYMSPKTMAKKLASCSINTNGNTSMSTLERKIKKTLIEQSILDEDEFENSDNDQSGSSTNMSNENCPIQKDDEIANEIKNLQNELKTVTKQCKSTLNNLLDISKESIEKQEIKKKISLLDSEIYEIYQKTRLARQTKKPLFKKDREKAMKAIKDRKILKAQLKEFSI